MQRLRLENVEVIAVNDTILVKKYARASCGTYSASVNLAPAKLLKKEIFIVFYISFTPSQQRPWEIYVFSKKRNCLQ